MTALPRGQLKSSARPLGPAIGSPRYDGLGKTTYTMLAWKDAVLKLSTVLALAYMIAGHELHHRRILQQKYFPGSVS